MMGEGGVTKQQTTYTILAGRVGAYFFGGCHRNVFHGPSSQWVSLRLSIGAVGSCFAMEPRQILECDVIPNCSSPNPTVGIFLGGGVNQKFR